MTVMWSSAFALAGSRMYRASSRTGASSLYVRTRHANKEGTRLHQMHRFTTTSSSTTNNEMNYVDKWLESIIKPKSFYEKHAEGPIRRYFYNVDFQGRLFLGTFLRSYFRMSQSPTAADPDLISFLLLF